MRIIFDNYAIAIKMAKCEGKRLIFKDFDGDFYHTDEYLFENIALAKLNDLVVNGYIIVNTLHSAKRMN